MTNLLGSAEDSHFVLSDDPEPEAAVWNFVHRSGRPDAPTLALCGDFDIASRGLLRAAIDSAIDNRKISNLTLDLRDVGFIDCAGLGDLVYAANQMTTRLGTATLRNVPAAIGRLLESTGIAECFPTT